MKALLSALLFLLLGFSGAAEAAQNVNVSISCGMLDRNTRLPAESECEKRKVAASGPDQAQITGGEVAPNEHHTAAIFFVDADGQSTLCTGMLIDARHLLTAGHCGCGRASSYQVSFEENPMSGSTVKGAIGIEGAPILFDPYVCRLGPRPGMDLALIKLAAEINQINYLYFGYPPTFASEEQLAGQSLKVVGFGETETGSVAVRMMASIPVLTPDCRQSPYSAFCAPFLEMILAEGSGSSTHRDSCGGDSGGPVFAKVDPKAMVMLPQCQRANPVPLDQDVLVGITSRAAPFTQPFSGHHCGGGGIYTLIGRRTVHAWFAANEIKPQGCIIPNK